MHGTVEQWYSVHSLTSEHERYPKSGDSGRMFLAEIGTGKDLAAIERRGYNS